MKLLTLRVSVLGAVTVSLLAAAQKANIEPSQPKWGDKIRVIYHPEVSGAKLRIADQVVALVDIWVPEGVRQLRLPMRPVGGELEAQLTMPVGASFVYCNFVTREAYDASAVSMVWTPEGKPARDAWHESMLFPFLKKDYLDRAAKELALYPDNWAVYRDKWFLSNQAADWKDMVRTDMALIEREAGEEQHRPVSALFALSYGYLLLGNQPEALAIIREMATRFPDAWLTASALSSYEYQSYVQHFSGDGGREVRQYRIEMAARNPKSQSTWQDLDSFGMGERLPLSVVEEACNAWKSEEPENPKPYLQLAEAYWRERIKPREALANIEQALDLLVKGELRLHGDIYGKMTELRLPEAYLTASQLALANGQASKALAYAKAAESTGKQTDAAAFGEEARIWEKLGMAQNAQLAWKEAWQRGDQSAYARLAEMYRESHGSTDGFEKSLGVSGMTAGAAPEDKRKAAPAFHATALDGAAIDSSQLRGKVIVANFWFTACGPCKAEIPDLNKLAAEFQGKDVVFLAFSLDDDEAVLHRFLKEFPFQYTIVPRAGDIAAKFGVESYPSHVIVGADGKVESMLVGAGERRAEELKTVIARLLGKGAGTR